jgi:hypothetical protein
MKALCSVFLLVCLVLTSACSPAADPPVRTDNLACSIYDAVLEHISDRIDPVETTRLPPIIFIGRQIEPTTAFPDWQDWRATAPETAPRTGAPIEQAFEAPPSQSLDGCTWHRAVQWRAIEAGAGQGWILQTPARIALPADNAVGFLYPSLVYMSPDGGLAIVQVQWMRDSGSEFGMHYPFPFTQSYRLERDANNAWNVTGTARNSSDPRNNG